MNRDRIERQINLVFIPILIRSVRHENPAIPAAKLFLFSARFDNFLAGKIKFLTAFLAEGIKK